MSLFISYRRGDSQYVTDRIYRELLLNFDADQVFRDIDSIQSGVDFAVAITRAMRASSILLVVVGTRWLDCQDGFGNCRIQAPDDFVRLEIEIGLREGLSVVPILIENASMPSSRELPGSIASLASRNAVSLRPDPDFESDMERLIARLKEGLSPRQNCDSPEISFGDLGF